MNRRDFRRIAAVAMCGLAVGEPLAAFCDDGAADPVVAEIRRQLDGGLFAGAVVASGDRAPAAFGDQCRVAKRIAMTPASRFDIASVTKTFVAVLCARLAAQGKLDVDRPFTHYLQDHVLAKENCEITVRDLAMHTGGFAYETCYQYTKDPVEYRVKAMSCRPKWARHEKFNYSCLNFVYLGWIAEKVTGLSLDLAVKEYVLDPLGLSHTTWGPVTDDGHVVELPVMLGRDSAWRPGYVNAIGQISDEGANMASPRPVGNAGLFSTAGDLRLYVQDLLARKTFEPAAYNLLFACAYQKGGARRSFGFDMCEEKRPPGFSDRTIYHSGWSGQTIAVDPVKGFCGVCLTARAGNHDACICARAKILSLMEAYPTVPFPSLARAGERPLLKIAVMSDVQGMPYAEDAGMRNLERALDIFAKLKPDVVVNAGDINDHGNDMDGVRYYKARCDARLGKLPHVACLGNHEIGFIRPENRKTRTRDVCLAEFNAIFGEGPSALVHKVIGGYDFISLAVATLGSFAPDDLRLLKDALDRAVARDAKKPVFVVTHFHPLDTVNSSDSKSQDSGLRALLNGYPQVVNLSGHTHNPLQDPRSIWQGEFTVLETSTLCYGCVEMKSPAANQVSCLIPYGHESVGCLFLEVYADRVVVRRFSVRDRREIEPDSPWTIETPYDPTRAACSLAKRRAAETVPDMGGDAEPTLWYDYGYVYLMFNAVKPLESVFGYRIELAENGGETKSYFHLSDYYRNPAYQQERVVFKVPPHAVKADCHYRCRIVPVGFFGKEGAALEWEFDIRSGYPCRADKPNILPE